MKGSALLYVVLLLALLLTVVLGLSTLISSQFEIMKNVGNSTVAFYAADAGIEHMLSAFVAKNENLLPGSFTLSETFGNTAEYRVTIDCRSIGGDICLTGMTIDPTCNADNYCIKSVGTYKGSKRAIMVKI